MGQYTVNIGDIMRVSDVPAWAVREAAASAALDGDTYSLVPSTFDPGPRILGWWHHERCTILTAGRCTCDTATKTPEERHG